MRSSLRGLTCAFAAIVIGCGTRQLDPTTRPGQSDTGVGVEAGAIGDGGVAGETGAIGPDAASPPDSMILINLCSNGRVDPGEECDDGNQIDGDGCSAGCRLECRWLCGCGAPCITTPSTCGDAFLASTEQCDDGNITNGDGCTATCTIEPGWICPAPGRRCFPICGDGYKVGPETCDDGNTVAGDGCSDICLVEPSDARCGDGVVSGAEPCDSGQSAPAGYGGCTAECTLGGYCGDAVVNGPEECDLGAHYNWTTYGNRTGCAPGCKFPHFCGDGILDDAEGEQCDLGPKNGTHDENGYSPCTAECRVLIL